MFTIDALAAIEEADHAQQQAVLMMVAKKVTPGVFHDIKRCISESERTHSYSIVRESAGGAQEDGFAFGTYFVDQYDDGGSTGDNFAGSICIPMANGEFLMFHYEI